MLFFLAALEEFPPHPRRMPEHQPIGLHVQPVKPRTTELRHVHRPHFKLVAAVLERTLNGFRRFDVAGANPQRHNGDSFLFHFSQPTPGTVQSESAFSLRTIRTAFKPPKAKELEIAAETGFSRAWFGT